MLQDLRLALRLLGRTPGFAAAAVLTLALGVGANTAIFTVAWHAILKPLPYPGADRLVHVWETFLPNDAVNAAMPANVHDWSRENRSFEVIAAYTYFRGASDLTGSGEPEQWQIRYVTGDYFRVFGMPPLAGRSLDAADVRPDSTAIVLSEGVWRRRFGADPAIVGRDIRLADQPRVVIGIMPAAFEIEGGRVDAWLPMSLPPEVPGKRLAAHYLGVVARLAPGVTLDQSIRDVKAIAARAAAAYPEENGKLSATVRSMQAERGRPLRAGLSVLAWAAGVVLLISCANLASLQLAQGVARGRELGIRAALGATRRRLISQLLVESLVLSAIGAAAGLALNHWLLAILGRIAPETIGAARTGIDTVVVLYASAVALAAAMIFAVAPAWRAATTARGWLRHRTDSGDRGTRRARSALVTAQIALAVTLLVASSLLLVSLARLLRVDPGFDPAGVLAFDVSLPSARYDTFAKREAALSRIDAELSGLPGVTSVCAINEIPFDAQGSMTYVPEGTSSPVGAAPRNITAGCVETLRLRLIAGQRFDGSERGRVAIVSSSFAAAAWPGQSAIGRRVHIGTRDGALIHIVGVVADARQVALDGRIGAQLYELATPESAFWPSRMLVRADVPVESVASAVRTAVRRADPNQPVARLRALEDIVSSSVAGRQFDFSLIAGFSVIALVLSAIGIYGLLAQIVAQRRREIGIRIALGSTAGRTVRLIMRSAWWAIGAGIPIGLVGAWFASRLLRQFMFQISETDRRVYLAAALTLAVITLAAAWLAARRAAAVDPVAAIR